MPGRRKEGAMRLRRAVSFVVLGAFLGVGAWWITYMPGLVPGLGNKAGYISTFFVCGLAFVALVSILLAKEEARP
jgi:hypothetical protein